VADHPESSKDQAAHLRYMREVMKFEDKEIMIELREELNVVDAKNAALLNANAVLLAVYGIALSGQGFNLGCQTVVNSPAARAILLVGFVALIFQLIILARNARVVWSSYHRAGQNAASLDPLLKELLTARTVRTKRLRLALAVFILCTIPFLIGIFMPLLVDQASRQCLMDAFSSLAVKP